jgi:hypothetical protein
MFQAHTTQHPQNDEHMFNGQCIVRPCTGKARQEAQESKKGSRRKNDSMMASKAGSQWVGPHSVKLPDHRIGTHAQESWSNARRQEPVSVVPEAAEQAKHQRVSECYSRCEISGTLWATSHRSDLTQGDGNLTQVTIIYGAAPGAGPLTVPSLSTGLQVQASCLEADPHGTIPWRPQRSAVQRKKCSKYM